jgi:acetyl-CoA carboxylase alpha subunit
MTLSQVLYNALSPEYKKSILFSETKTVKTCTQKLNVFSTIFMTEQIKEI